jgi:hypothetical protein
MDVASAMFNLYVAYLVETTSAVAPMGKEEFQKFMRMWDVGLVVVMVIYQDSKMVGFSWIFTFPQSFGSAASASIGPTYMQKEHRSAYKVTIYAVKQAVEAVKERMKISSVLLTVAQIKACRLPRLARVAATETNRVFVL